MTITELYVHLDLQVDSTSKIAILDDVARRCDEGYLFVDSDNGKMHLFDKCGNVDDINKVKSIGDNAFVSRKNLTSITIPDSVETIDAFAFWFCINLTSITIPNSVKSIGNNVFYNCESLTSITIPNSVKDIGAGAFAYCKSLTNITIPDSVKDIGVNAFYGCTSLTSITFKNKTLNEVKSMSYYPWRIEDESIIKCNVASSSH